MNFKKIVFSKCQSGPPLLILAIMSWLALQTRIEADFTAYSHLPHSLLIEHG